MAMPATKKGRKNKNRSSFLCSCFGFSSKVSADHADGKPLPAAQNHQETPTTEILTSSKEIHVVEDDDEEEKKKRISSAADEFATNKRDEATSERSKKGGEYSPTIKQKRGGYETWTKQRKLSHSMSLPLPKEAEAEAGGEQVAAVGGEIDSMFGAVVVMVTLVVMVIWGKVCAILCAAAWLYFVPRFRANLDGSNAIKFKNGLDFDSREHKKMVVLQGLLQRNRPQ